MRTVTYDVADTLDGLIFGPDGQYEFFDFELIDTQTVDTGTQITTHRRHDETAGPEGAHTA